MRISLIYSLDGLNETDHFGQQRDLLAAAGVDTGRQESSIGVTLLEGLAAFQQSFIMQFSQLRKRLHSNALHRPLPFLPSAGACKASAYEQNW